MKHKFFILSILSLVLLLYACQNNDDDLKEYDNYLYLEINKDGQNITSELSLDSVLIALQCVSPGILNPIEHQDTFLLFGFDDPCCFQDTERLAEVIDRSSFNIIDSISFIVEYADASPDSPCALVDVVSGSNTAEVEYSGSEVYLKLDEW